MLRLNIAGRRVNLSDTSTAEFYDRNCFFTKQGTHTHDIDIDLSDPENASVYQNMNRVDRIGRPTGRKALLWDEHGVWVCGDEIILEINDGKAKIQLVGGNSQFNSVIGEGITISQVEMGDTGTITAAHALATVTAPDDYDYCFPPVCVKATGTSSTDTSDIVSYITTANRLVNYHNLPSGAPDAMEGYVEGTTFSPQPFLHAVVRRLLSGMGYTVGYNFIKEDERLRRLIVVNGYGETQYNKMLPDWEVSDFISEVENLCNVLFVVDQLTNTVSIMHAHNWYQTTGKEYVPHRDIYGEIEKKFDQTPAENLVYHNVSYKLPSLNNYKYMAIEQKLWDALTYEHCEQVQQSDFEENFLVNIWTHINNDTLPTDSYDVPRAVKDAYNEMKCYYDDGLGLEFPFVQSGYRGLREINRYGGMTDESDSSSMSLKMVPAEVVSVYWKTAYGTGDDFYFPALLARNAVAIAEEPEEEPEDEERKGLNDYIKEGMEEESNIPEHIFLAYYIGIYPVVNLTDATPYPHPIALPCKQWLCHPLQFSTRHSWCQMNYAKVFGTTDYDLSINAEHGMYESYWKYALDIDMTEEWTIRFRTARHLDSRKIFVIGNRPFYCKELKYTIDGKRMSELVEGVFYPIINNADVQPDEGDTGDDTCSITYQLDGVISSNDEEEIARGASYSTEIIVDGSIAYDQTVRYLISVTVGGVDMTYLYRNGRMIYIPSVTGDVVIVASAIIL